MDREWDDFRRARNPADAGRDNVFGRTSARGPEYGRRDRRQFVGWLTERMTEAYRVLKPGGHALVWSIPRTSHWTAWALEDARFDIRDCVLHLFGSGFPKSLDVAKAIDKVGGVSPEVQGAVLRAARERAGLTRAEVAARVGCKEASIHNWEDGRARAAGRPVEYITPSPEYRDALADLLGYTSDERRIVGIGGGSRSLYESGHRGIAYGGPVTEDAARWDGWGTALKPGQEMWWLVRKPLAGTVAANILEHGTGALNIAACMVAHASAADLAESQAKNPGRADKVTSGTYGSDRPQQSVNDAGRWPPNIVLTHSAACDIRDEGNGEVWLEGPCAPDCPVAELDRQSGVSVSRIGKPRKSALPGNGYGMTHTGTEYADAGGASRFYPDAPLPGQGSGLGTPPPRGRHGARDREAPRIHLLGDPAHHPSWRDGPGHVRRERPGRRSLRDRGHPLHPHRAGPEVRRVDHDPAAEADTARPVRGAA